MEIVIKLDDELYNEILSRKYSKTKLEKAVAKGKPLPANHGRLIDADALQTEMEKDVRKAMSFVDLKDFVWIAPTIIEGSDSEC